MKRIFIYKNKSTNLISRVDLHEKQNGLSNEEIQNAIYEFNSNLQNDRYVVMLEIDSNIYKIISFLLNKEEYKEGATIENIIEKISDMKNDIYDFFQRMESVRLECQKLVEKLGGKK